MDDKLIITIIITSLIWFIFVMFGVFIVFMFKKFKKYRNPIDFIILELNKTGVVMDRAIGRRMPDKDNGYKYVTCGFMPGSIKHNFGYNISDNDLFPNKFGNGRVTCIGVYKDKTFASGLIAESKTEDVVGNDGKPKTKKVFIPLREIENPESLSLTPINQESLRLYLDNIKATMDIFKEEKSILQKILAYSGVILFALVIVFTIVWFILMLNQGPDYAAKMYALRYGSITTLMQNATAVIPAG